MPAGIAEIKALQALVIACEPDIRLNMYPPFSTTSLNSFRELLLDLSRRLTEISGLGHEVSAELLSEPAEILERLETDCRPVAEQYFDHQAQADRRSRPTHLVAQEIDAAAAPGKKLKQDVLAYLTALKQFLTPLSVTTADDPS